MITIVDCGSQFTQNIARRIREQGVYTEIVPYKTPWEHIKRPDLEGIIISGGQFSVYDSNAPMYQKALLENHVPVLGICYGQQSIAHLLGGKVTATHKREYGITKVSLKTSSPLFRGIVDSELSVLMSHGDIVENMPPGFVQLALSENGHVAAMERGNIYAVQFHPEVDHTMHGRLILENFLQICDAQRTWDPEKEYDRIVERTREQIAGKVGIGGISGGVDSTTASVLVRKIAGSQYHPLFVNNGLLRLNEEEEVRRSLDPFHLHVRYIDASNRFLENLRGITHPDEKRKRIGHAFIAVFMEAAKEIDNVAYLVQGTLYPDVIESVPVYGASSKIKRHHNVGGLPEHMGLPVVEPFRHLFKDEVRKIAADKLGLPRDIVWRHPFPGPGLAVRIVGTDVTPEKLDILRKADHLFVEELKQRGLYEQISQAFAGLTDVKNVGVMGDEGTYESEIRLRAVVTNDFMSADVFRFDEDDLQTICNRIINEVKGVNRVFYDRTQKPPGTIEWE